MEEPQTEEYEIIQQKERIRKRDRLRGFIGLILFIFGPTTTISYSLFLIYKIFKKNNKAIGQLMFVCIYMFYFAKKNKSYINFIMKFNPIKYFQNWEIVMEEKPDSEKVLFPYHPHSVLSLALQLNLNMEGSPFKNAHALGSREALSIPPISIFYRWWGIEGVNPENFERLMSTNQNICFVPGGFEEATITSHKEYRIYIINRKGFIKYALQYGYKIQPVFVFNENKMYRTFDTFMKQRVLLNNLKIPSVIFASKYGFLPEQNLSIVTVIGKAINLPQLGQPSREMVEKYHEIYIQHLKELFYNNVDKYDPGAKLVIYGEDLLPYRPNF